MKKVMPDGSFDAKGKMNVLRNANVQGGGFNTARAKEGPAKVMKKSMVINMDPSKSH